MADHRSFIRRDGDEFTVTIDPPLDGGSFDAAYPTHKEAFSYAIGVRVDHGFPVVDLASDAHLLETLIGGAK